MENKGLIPSNSAYTFTLPRDQTPIRADKFLATQFSQYSRSFLKKVFDQGNVKHNNAPLKPGNNIKPGDHIIVTFQSPETIKKEIPADVQVSIVAQEKDFLIISKPAGLIVHKPTHESKEISLSDWLADNYTDIAHVGSIDRPGIVHRLDKETSGLMIIPRTNEAFGIFTDMFKERTISKTYIAVVQGHPEKKGTIAHSIGRHPGQRNKMTHFAEYSQESSIRPSKTHFEVETYFDNNSLVIAKPVTGRTHQIRVHLKAIGHPLVGDSLYGSSSKFIKRHALHAHKLEFTYKGTAYSFTSTLPQDMQNLVAKLSQKQ